MASVAQRSCRQVAPLLARYNDPDLDEVERVALSTHILGCQACLAQLQHYRALDSQLRGMRPIVLEPRVRAAVLDRVAASSAGFGVATAALPWRHAWSGAAAIVSLTTILLAAGLTTALAARHPDARFMTRTTTNGALVRPVTTTLLNANPTRPAENTGEILAFKRPIGQMQVQAQATRPAAVSATIRSVDETAGRIVVSVGGARGDERLLVLRDTAIVRANGHPGTIADLVAGLQVQLQRETSATGGLIAREIMIGR